MTFGLKMRDIMEIYINNMVVKSRKVQDDLKDLEDAFDILDEYNMELNPSNYHFEMRSCKFLR